MQEKLYLFNPFETKKATNNESRDIYNEVFKGLIKEPKKECDLRRFKNAYQSMEEKINSLKKKQDAIKYEEIGEN